MLNLNKLTMGDEAILAHSRAIEHERDNRVFPRGTVLRLCPVYAASRAFERGDHKPNDPAQAESLASTPAQAGAATVSTPVAGSPTLEKLRESAGDIIAHAHQALRDPADAPLAVGDEVEVLPHPEGGRHPGPFWQRNDDRQIGKIGVVTRITIEIDAPLNKHRAVANLNGGESALLPLSALRRKPKQEGAK